MKHLKQAAKNKKQIINSLDFHIELKQLIFFSNQIFAKWQNIKVAN